MDHPTHILKFGGTSLQNKKFIKQAVQIVITRAQSARPYVVVSALEGVTDTLITLAGTQESNQMDGMIERLAQKHIKLFDQLADSADHRKEQLQNLFSELKQSIQTQADSPIEQRARKDRILSVGERASALIFAASLSNEGHPAESFEAYQFIKTDSTFGQAKVQPDATRALVRQFLDPAKTIPVVTGFIGSDEQKRITTLGRSGSDYTAGLLAEALEADHLEIWTDVDGVLSADPRWVPTATPIDELSFADIGELSAHGANVIHPKTIRPISGKDTSVLVKNSYNPGHPGTLINSGHKSNGSFKTITITGPFTRLQVDDNHTPELLENISQWLGDEPDSEAFSINRNSAFEPARFLIRQSLYEKVQESIEEWASKRDVHLNIQNDIFKVKKFSNHFDKNERFTQRIWNLLAAKELRPLQVNRNREERFISFLFERDDAQRAARLMNDYLQPHSTTIDLFIAGTGAVGNTLLEQLKNIDNKDTQFRLLGSCNSRHTLWNDDGLNFHSTLDWTNAAKTNWDIITEKLTASHRHNLIFVDATGSEEVARLYPTLFKHGIHIVTPSKLANTFEQSFFDEIQLKAAENDAMFKYETTVGAGLPVISTLNNLQQSGDEVLEISGVVSGTMTYLFNQLEQGIPFSEAIIDAREKGYAEPDPRDDLSGEDVARKFLTLARTLGLKIEREELQVESLIPQKLETADRETFLAELKNYDSQWQQRLRKAEKQDKTLRYSGTLKDGVIKIGVDTVSKSSPLGQLKGTDNMIQIYSRYYNQTPLVIQGPGAGKKVTAAGVLANTIQVANKLSSS